MGVELRQKRDSTLQPWLLALRPKTLPAAVVPVWVGCVLAWKTHGTFDLLLAVCTLLGAVFIQLATNLFNDAIDHKKGADTEGRLGPVRVTASGLLSGRQVMAAGGVFVALAVVAGIPLFQARGWPILAIGVPSLFLAYGYTGGPFPLAYLGLGEVFVVLFFGLVAVMGTVFIQTGAWTVDALLLGLVVGGLSAILITINNLRDVEEDTTTGKKTLAVRLGWGLARLALIDELLLVLVPLFFLLRRLGLGGGTPGWLLLGGLLVAGGALAAKVITTRPSARYNRFLMLCGMLLLAFAVGWTVVLMR